jgi:MFS transporter, ACS family, hexuronate transporter
MPGDRGDRGVTTGAAGAPTATGRIGRLVVMFVAHAVGTANVTIVLAAAPAVERSLGLSHAEFGAMLAAYYVSILLFSLPAGLIVDRFGIGPSLVASHALLGGGILIVGRAQGLPLAALGLLACGIGYSLINPATARGVLTFFPARGRATAMGVKQTGVPAGSILTALATAAVGDDSWRDLALAVALLTLLSGATSLIFGLRRPDAEGAVRVSDLLRLLARPRLAWFNGGALLYALGQGSFFAYLVLFLHDAMNADSRTTSLCLALAHAASAAGRVAWGLTSDLFPRGGRKLALIGCGAASTIGAALLVVLPGIAGLIAVAPLSMVLGLTFGGYAGLAQTAAVEIVEPRMAGASIGYNMIMTNLGMAIGPALFGATVDQAGYAPAWIAIGVVMAIGAWLFSLGLVVLVTGSGIAQPATANRACDDDP